MQYKDIESFLQDKISEYNKNFKEREKSFSLLKKRLANTGYRPSSNYILSLITDRKINKEVFIDSYDYEQTQLKLSNSELLWRMKTIDFSNVFDNALALANIGTMLPENINLCFIDDKYYSKMENEKIYYIQPSPYYHNLTNKKIIERFSMSPFNSEDNMNKINSILNVPFIDYKYQENMMNVEEMKKIEKRIYKKIMYYVKEFFYITNSTERTKKIRILLGKFTRKRRK